MKATFELSPSDVTEAVRKAIAEKSGVDPFKLRHSRVRFPMAPIRRRRKFQWLPPFESARISVDL